jgi:hypothetical protein
VLSKLKTMCDKGAGKKAAAEELVKSFDESKDGINSEFEKKKADNTLRSSRPMILLPP